MSNGASTVEAERPAIRLAALQEIVDLRHAVLRANLPKETAIFPGDANAETRHIGAFIDGRPVGCATFHQSSWNGEPAWQLRGMAVDPALRSRGVGRQMLRFAEDLLRQSSPIRAMWCNARTPAVGFYQRQGWEVVSPEFVIETAGPHYRLFKRL